MGYNMDHPRVSIIILNWNGWKDTVECLESVYRINYPNYDVIVVDNGSKDDSIRKIKEYAEGKIKVVSKFFEYNPSNKPIKVFEVDEDEAKQGKFNRPVYEKYDVNRRMILIKNRDNYGFAGGNNVGIKFALSVLNPDYVLLLNNDTVVDPNFLTELVKVAESDEKIGIVGPKIYYYDYNGRSDVIHSAGAKINPVTGNSPPIGINEIDNGQYDKIRNVDYIEGSCMLIKARLLYYVGFFDEDFFMYWEETDLCTRVRKLGYKVFYISNSNIWHKVPFNIPRHKDPFRLYFLTRNRFWYMQKNYDHIIYKIHLLYTLLIEVPLKFVVFLSAKDVKTLNSYLEGIKDGLF